MLCFFVLFAFFVVKHLCSPVRTDPVCGLGSFNATLPR